MAALHWLFSQASVICILEQLPKTARHICLPVISFPDAVEISSDLPLVWASLHESLFYTWVTYWAHLPGMIPFP